jgi:hypothetical protein
MVKNWNIQLHPAVLVMRNFTLITAAVLLSGYAYAATDALILNAIGDVETGSHPNPRLAIGDWGKARGRYQQHRGSFIDGCTQLMREGKSAYSFDQWKSPIVQDDVALAYIRWIRDRMATAGLPHPTAEQIALCWNYGFSKSKAIKFDITMAPTDARDYATRVGNLVRATKTI